MLILCRLSPSISMGSIRSTIQPLWRIVFSPSIGLCKNPQTELRKNLVTLLYSLSIKLKSASSFTIIPSYAQPIDRPKLILLVISWLSTYPVCPFSSYKQNQTFSSCLNQLLEVRNCVNRMRNSSPAYIILIDQKIWTFFLCSTIGESIVWTFQYLSFFCSLYLFFLRVNYY